MYDTANYTMFYYQWEEQFFPNAELSNLFTKFERFNNLNLKDLFNARNKYKEIGAETGEFFEHNLKNSLNEAYVLYNDKLKMQIENFNDLYSRTVTETGENTDKVFFNPVTGNNPKLQNMATNKYEREKTYGYIYSNPQIMEQVEKIKLIFFEILEYFDNLFMAVV